MLNQCFRGTSEWYTADIFPNWLQGVTVLSRFIIASSAWPQNLHILKNSFMGRKQPIKVTMVIKRKIKVGDWNTIRPYIFLFSKDLTVLREIQKTGIWPYFVEYWWHDDDNLYFTYTVTVKGFFNHCTNDIQCRYQNVYYTDHVTMCFCKWSGFSFFKLY